MVKNYFKIMFAILFASNVMAQNIPSYVPKDGLVGWWPFNGNANDESGNGNHGTVNGATLTSDRNGKPNCAYDFDGVSNNIIVSNEKQFDFIKEFTISVWIKPNQTFNGQKFIITKFKNYDDSYSLGLENNKIDARLNPKKNGWQVFSGSTNIDKSLWINLNMILKNNLINIYMNGKLEFSKSFIDSLYDSQAPLVFGDFYGNNFYLDRLFNGSLDDIAIYNRALTDQEVKQLYEGCTKETATSSSFNSVIYTTNTPVNLSANPTGGTFNGEAVANNSFNPSKAKLGKNQVKYNFKNSTGCADSTNFTMILVDTLGNKCSTYDTILKINFKLTTGIKAGQLTSMNVYPNPASELIIIEANDIQALSGYKYKIVDLQGKEVYNALATSTKTEISLKSIGAKGMYILHIVDEKGVSIENKKIVLE